MKKYLLIITSLLLVGLLASSCRHQKDCKGRKKRANTKMGGWL